MRFLIPLVAFSLALAGTTYSANVIWDDGRISGWTSVHEGGSAVFSIVRPAYEGQWSLSLFVDIAASEILGDYVLTGESANLLFSGNWTSATENTIIDESTTRHLENYFYHQFIDDPPYEGGTFSSSSFKVAAEEIFYLAFCMDIDYPNLEVIYGWVQLRMEDDGTISYMHSAYDLDGGPMVVGSGAWTGGIPEPSGGMLLLLGVAVLGLRRELKS